MRLSTALFILFVTNSSIAANEEQFGWMGVVFCHTNMGEVIERFPNTKYFEEFELLAVTSSGETLGAVYDELFFLVLPNGVIAGLQVPIVSGDMEKVIREMDLLAAERWSGTVRKVGSLPEITWFSLSSDTGRDVHMHLNENESSPLYNIGYSMDDGKWTVIGLSSISGCDRAHEGD
jgi:hypothetical protein